MQNKTLDQNPNTNNLLAEIQELRKQLVQYQKKESIDSSANELSFSKEYDLVCVHYLDGKIIRGNDEMEELFEIRASDGTYQNLHQLALKDSLKEWQAYFQALQEKKVTRGILKMIGKGGVVYILNYKSYTEQSADNQPNAKLFACILTQTKIHFSHENLHEILFRKNRTAVLIIDQEGYFIDANPEARRYFELIFENLTNQTIAKCFQNLSISFDFEKVLKQVGQGISPQINIQGQSHTGHTFYAQLTFQQSSYHGKPSILITAYDTTHEHNNRSEILARFDELRIVKDTIRHVSSENRLEAILMKVIAKLQELGYWKSAGYYLIDRPSPKRFRLRLSVNFSTKLQKVIYEINPSDFSEVFREKHVLKIDPYTLSPHQEKGLLFIPILIAEQVGAALLFEPSEEDSAHFLLSLFGVELSRFITQLKLNNRLANSENRLRLIADNASALLRMTNRDGKFIYFNYPWSKFTGIQGTSRTAAQWTQLVHPQDLPHILQELKKQHKKHEIFQLTYQIQRKDGEYRKLLETCTPYFDERRIFQGVIGSAVDITDQISQEDVKTRQELVDYSEQRLQNAFVHSGIFALTINAKGNVTFINEYFSEITGWTGIEVLNKSLTKVLQIGSLRQVPFQISELIAASHGKIQTKDGNKFPVYLQAVILNSATGGLASVTLIGGNADQKNKILRAFHKGNRLLYRIFDNTPDLIQIISTKGKFLFVNKAWKTAIGYQHQDIPMLNFRTIIHRDAYKTTRRNLLELPQRKILENFQTAFSTKEGRKIELSGTISCEYENGEVTAYRGVFHDVTDKLRAEKTEKLYYSTSRLTLKHADLRTIYQDFYQQLKNTIQAEGFILVLKNPQQRNFSFPYYVNPEGTNIGIKGKEFAKYAVQRFMRPMIFHKEQISKLIDKQKLNQVKDIPQVWLGAPLIPSEQDSERDWQKIESIGMIIIQSFQKEHSHSKRDLKILSFVARQFVGAIERHRNHDHMKLQTARLQAIYESGTHLMWSIDRERKLTRCNRNYTRGIRDIFGIRPQVGMRIATLRGNHQKHNIHLWLRKYELAFEGNPQQFEISYEVGGGKIWLRIFLSPIILPNQLEITEVSGVAHDITERKESEISLAQNEEKFRNIFESFQDVYFRTDLKGKILMVSPSIKELIDKTSDEIIGKNITDDYIRRSAFKILVKSLIKKGQVTNYQAEIRASDKIPRSEAKTLLSNFRIVRTPHNNRPVALDGVARDITDLRKTTQALKEAKELAEKSLEVKKLFLSNMSHEIRTPMNGIIGMTDLLLNTPLTHEQEIYVNTVKSSSDVLLNILNDILDLSKIEEGKMLLHPKPFSLTGLLDKLQAVFMSRARQKGIRLFSRFSDHTSEYMIADATRLTQVISNLVSNALKFTQVGSVKINVKTHQQISEDESIIKIEVIDTGIGISEANQKILFDKFTQVENNYTKSYEGTGLGLAISQELSYLMGGEIGVSSTLNKGSNFWFTFRAKNCLPSDVVLESEAQKLELSGQITTRPHVLLVDDNIVNLRVAQNILDKSGCRTIIAQSGTKAVKIIQTQLDTGTEPFDLIFMDIQMPVMNGIMTMQKIREILHDKCPPVIAVTAYSMPEEREGFMKAGMDDYLAKPVKARNIINKVLEWTQKTHLSKRTGQHQKAQNKTDTAPITAQKFSIPETDTFPPIINFEVIKQLAKYGGMDGVGLFYEDFERETLELILEAETGWESQNREQMRSALHTIKGSAGTLGIQRVANLAQKLERELKTDFPKTAAQDLERLQNFFQEFRDNYQRLLKYTVM